MSDGCPWKCTTARPCTRPSNNTGPTRFTISPACRTSAIRGRTPTKPSPGNVLATHYLFDALRRERLTPRVLITSSATVYQPASHALRESDAVNPNTPYGTSKLAQEMVARRSWEDDGIPGLMARSFNHVGPRQSPSFVAPSMAKQIAEIEAGRKQPRLAMGNLETQRDIMDVRDTVRAYRALMQSAKPGVPYNVCSGTPVSIRALVEMFVVEGARTDRADAGSVTPAPQ